MDWEQHNRFVAQQQLRRLKQRQPDQFTSYGIPGAGAPNPNPNLQMQVAGGGGYQPKTPFPGTGGGTPASDWRKNVPIGGYFLYGPDGQTRPYVEGMTIPPGWKKSRNSEAVSGAGSGPLGPRPYPGAGGGGTVPPRTAGSFDPYPRTPEEKQSDLWNLDFPGAREMREQYYQKKYGQGAGGGVIPNRPGPGWDPKEALMNRPGAGFNPSAAWYQGSGGFNPGALRPNPPPPFQFYGENAGILNIEKMGIEEAQRLAAEAQQQGLGMAGGFLNDPLVGGLQQAGMGLLREPTSRAKPIFANLTGGIRRNQLLRGQEAGANLANRFGFDWAGDRGAIGNELATETANELGTLAQNVALQEANRMDQLRLQNLGAASGIAGQQQGWRKDLADALFGLEFESPDYTSLIQPGPSGIPGYAGGGGGGRRRLGRPGTRKVGNVGWWKGNKRSAFA